MVLYFSNNHQFLIFEKYQNQKIDHSWVLKNQNQENLAISENFFKKKLRIEKPPILVFKRPLGFMKDLVDSKQLLEL